MKKTLFVSLALVSPALPVLAQAHQHTSPPTVSAPAPTPQPAAAASGLPMATAEVRRVDVGAGKVTLKHGDIPNLDMPPMTMVFQVRNPAQLGNLKPGDKIRFSADKIHGAYTVIDLEAVPSR
ncbi:MAG: copper-binding protein [Hydrogenophaga sp.]|jgi:Cu/Ag efflux protein CusF|nr:copper-binding protein [Hydrogenophaga sp.]